MHLSLREVNAERTYCTSVPSACFNTVHFTVLKSSLVFHKWLEKQILSKLTQRFKSRQLLSSIHKSEASGIMRENQTDTTMFVLLRTEFI